MEIADTNRCWCREKDLCFEINFIFNGLKKIAAILFLLILAFNFCGYRWLLSYMEEKATVRLEQKLDAGDYDESQLVEVKIPAKLLYHSNQTEYETFYGETEWNGEYYQYVKRKLSNDTLYLLCIAHTEKNKIQAVKTDFFKFVNDIPARGGQQKSEQPSFVKLLMSEFLQNNNTPDFSVLKSEIKTTCLSVLYFHSQFNPSTPAQPPEQLFS